MASVQASALMDAASLASGAGAASPLHPSVPGGSPISCRQSKGIRNQRLGQKLWEASCQVSAGRGERLSQEAQTPLPSLLRHIGNGVIAVEVSELASVKVDSAPKQVAGPSLFDVFGGGALGGSPCAPWRTAPPEANVDPQTQTPSRSPLDIMSARGAGSNQSYPPWPTAHPEAIQEAQAQMRRRPPVDLRSGSKGGSDQPYTPWLMGHPKAAADALVRAAGRPALEAPLGVLSTTPGGGAGGGAQQQQQQLAPWPAAAPHPEAWRFPIAPPPGLEEVADARHHVSMPIGEGTNGIRPTTLHLAAATAPPASSCGLQLPQEHLCRDAGRGACRFPAEVSSAGGASPAATSVASTPSPAGVGKRFTCKFVFDGYDLERDAEFELVPRLIGRGGGNMKDVARACDGKVRIRGRGSGHREVAEGRPGASAEEADVHLQIALSCKSEDNLEEGRKRLEGLLESIAVHFERFRRKKGATAPMPALYSFVGGA